MLEEERLRLKLKALEGKDDTESLFMRFVLINELQSEEELDAFLLEYQEQIFKEDPRTTIAFHVDFYLRQNLLYEAIKTLEQYQTRPYISMEVEEFMTEMKKKIFDEEKRHQKSHSDEELYKCLLSNKEDKIVYAISELSTRNINLHFQAIQKFLLSDANYKYKPLILFILVMQKSDHIFKVKRGEDIFEFNPKKHKLPFDKAKYKECVNYLDANQDSAQVITSAKEMLNQIEIINYPKSIFDVYECEYLSLLLYDLSASYLGLNSIKENILKRFSCTIEAIEKDKVYIESLLKAE